MIKDLSIEKLTEKDIEAAYEVFKITIPYAFKQSEEDCDDEVAQEEVLVKRKLLQVAISEDNKNLTFFVAKYQDKVIGTISFGPCSEDIKDCTNNELAHLGELGSLFVLPEYQNKGVGSALINTLIDYLRSEGINEFCLDSGYKQAQQRWIKKFEEPYKVAKDHWAPGVDNMVWRCKI